MGKYLYQKSGDFIEITIKDASLRKIGGWKFSTADRKLGAGVLGYIKKKYGFYYDLPTNNVPEEKPKDKFWGMS